MMKDLKNFYEAVANDATLSQQLDNIADQEDFAKRFVQLGAKKGYRFSVSEVLTSIQANTASEQGDYFCLPIGCWHKASSI